MNLDPMFAKSIIKLDNSYTSQTLWVIAIFFLGACNTIQKEVKPIDTLIASVYDKKLKLSDLAGLFPASASKEDSAQIISEYAVRWTQDQVFLTEAEKHLPADYSMEELLKKYRASLISLHFQQQLIQENLDSTVSETELREYYEKNKSQYQLETAIIRCYFIKLPSFNAKDEKNIQSWWSEPSESNLKKLARFVERNGGTYHLQDSIWHNVSDIEALFPNNRISTRNWNKGEELSFHDDKSLYLFKVFELVSKQESAPMSYVEPKAKLVILNKRKNKLLEDFKTKLYETEMRKNNVKIYYN